MSETQTREKVRVDELLMLDDEDKSVAIEILDYSQFALHRNGFITGSATQEQNKDFLIAITRYLRCLKKHPPEPDREFEIDPGLNLKSG